MRTQAVQASPKPSFKGIVSQKFINQYVSEIKKMPKSSPKKKDLVALYAEVKKRTKMFDIELFPPQVKPKDETVEKIIPDKTPVLGGSLYPLIKFRANSNAPKEVVGKDILIIHGPSMPYKSIKTLYGRPTGYVTLNPTENEFPPAKDVLQDILNWEKSAKKDMEKMISDNTFEGRLNKERYEVYKKMCQAHVSGDKRNEIKYLGQEILLIAKGILHKLSQK